VKSNKNTTVEIKKAVNLGHFPLFVSMAHKSLEKGAPRAKEAFGGSMVYNIPVDLLRLSVGNEELLKNVESVEFIYKTHA